VCSSDIKIVEVVGSKKSDKLPYHCSMRFSPVK
jgi:hypothetical protein